MLFVVGLILLVFLILIATGVLFTFAVWFIIKAIAIGLAIAGALVGYAIFQSEGGVVIGAVAGLGLGVLSLAYLQKRADERERLERLAKEAEEARRKEEIARRRADRKALFADSSIGRTVRRWLAE